MQCSTNSKAKTHCVKSARIGSFGPYFPAFGLSLFNPNTENKDQKNSEYGHFWGWHCNLFVQALGIYGVPSRARTDKGGENSLI